MVQMNLFTGQQEDADVENPACGPRQGRVGWDEVRLGTDIYTLPYINR